MDTLQQMAAAANRIAAETGETVAVHARVSNYDPLVRYTVFINSIYGSGPTIEIAERNAKSAATPEQDIVQLEKAAAKLGYTLVPTQPPTSPANSSTVPAEVNAVHSTESKSLTNSGKASN